MLAFLKDFLKSTRQAKERTRAARRRRALYARPGMHDFQLQQRIVPTTTRFEWIGGDPASPTNYNDLDNWIDLATNGIPTSFMNTNSYLQFDGNAKANCVVQGLYTSVGNVSILSAADKAGAFKFTIEISAHMALWITNNTSNEPDYYGNLHTSEFRSGTIQVDSGPAAGGGGLLGVGGGTLYWDGPLAITVDYPTRFKGEFVL